MGFNDDNYDAPPSGIHADFDNYEVRRNFTKKVLFLLGAQLLITFGGMFAFHGLQASGAVTLGEGIFSVGLVYTSMALALVLLIGATCCCPMMLRKSPHNIIFLLVWTLFETHVVSFVALTYSFETVSMAFGATSVTVLVVAGLVAFTNFDFSKLLPIMGAILLCWVLMIFASLIIGIAWNQTLYGCIGVTIFTIYLAVDLKMMIGGGKFQYGEDDYVLAAINIYLDIINIFLYMLSIFSDN